MNVKDNVRRKHTRAMIGDVFTQLLEDRDLSSITVSEICKRAAINRSTFYANYDDVYDLADKLRAHLEEEVAALYDDNDMANHYAANDFLRLFQHVREHQTFYKTYFKLGYDQQNPVNLCDLKQADQYLPDGHVAYHLEFFRAGFNAMLKMWLDNGCRETPEELAAILQSEYRQRPLF